MMEVGIRGPRRKTWALRHTKKQLAAVERALVVSNDPAVIGKARRFFDLLRENEENGITRDQSREWRSIMEELNQITIIDADTDTTTETN